jgi:peptide/nickel transport system substrate-binding protein
MTDTDNLSRRRFLKGTGAAATAAALAGCTGGDGDDPETTAEPTDTSGGNETTDEGGDDTTEETDDFDASKRIRGVMVGTATTMDPIAATDTASGEWIQNIFDGLTNYPNGHANAETQLAADYTTENDGATLVFNLKEGATYNNGDEVTAGDVAYSWERLAASENSRRSGFLLDFLGVQHETHMEEQENEEGETEEVEVYTPGTLGIETNGDYEVTVNLEEPFYASLELIAYSSFFLLPEGIVGDIEDYDGQMDYDEFASVNPVGAGPYTLTNWEQATNISVDARDDYHGGEIMNAGIDAPIFTEVNPAYTYATVNVNADGPVIPSERYDPELRDFEGTDDQGRQYGTYGPFDPNDMTAQYYEVATLSTFYYSFNCAAVEKPVRQAVAHAMNQQTINEQIIPTPSKPAYFFNPPALFPGGGSNYNDLQEEWPYGFNTAQIQEARQVMEDAGYSSSNTYQLNFDMYSSLASAYGQDMYTLLRDKLQQAHIDLQLRTADWSTFLQRGRNGNFEMFTLGWLADYPGGDNFIALMNPPNTITPDGSAYSNWGTQDTEAVQQAEEAWTKVTENYGLSDEAAEARDEAYLTIERANWEDAVLLPTHHGITQSFSYEWKNSPRFGAMGASRSMATETKIGDRGEYE